MGEMQPLVHIWAGWVCEMTSSRSKTSDASFQWKMVKSIKEKTKRYQHVTSWTWKCLDFKRLHPKPPWTLSWAVQRFLSNRVKVPVTETSALLSGVVGAFTLEKGRVVLSWCFYEIGVLHFLFLECLQIHVWEITLMWHFSVIFRSEDCLAHKTAT